MNLIAGLIVGLITGAVMYGVTKEVYWLPIGALLGAFVGELRLRRRQK